MFEQLEMAAPDAILGLTEAFKSDTNPNKINLGVGVYKDAKNQTPVLDCVKQAETRLLAEETSKGYLPIPGAADYGVAVRALMLGANHEIIASNRARTAHTPGGTGALRVAGDFIKNHCPGNAIWLSGPTWANHPQIFKAAGLEVKEYPYYDAENKVLAFDALLAGLREIPEGDVVLLHGCCHNPSGMDPDLEQWKAIAEVVRERKLLPLFDFAYQGFGDGLEEDAAGLRVFCAEGCEMLICSSFSKNFGLYNERTGAFTIIGATADAADHAFSHAKKCIRTNYSNPPFHGGAVTAIILQDDALRALWEQELAEMRDRVSGMRQLFVDTLNAKGVSQDFSFITRQKGMFSFSGLNKEQVQILREQHALYIVGSGRINVAGMTEDNMDALCGAIAGVL